MYVLLVRGSYREAIGMSIVVSLAVRITSNEHFYFLFFNFYIVIIQTKTTTTTTKIAKSARLTL